MRRVLSEIFTRPTQTFEKYFSKKSNIEARNPPCDLLEELKSKKKMKSFIALMNEKQKNGLHVLKKLIVMHLCLIYSAELCETFKKIDMKQSSQSQWLDDNIIKPYRLFISKVCHSQQLYRAIQVNGVVQFSLQNLFFVIKLLKDLLECKKKISSLHHYYSKESAVQYPFLLDNFVCILACHAQRIYSVFKAIMGQFIRFPKIFICNQQVERIMKFIMQVELVKINQEMRELFLSSLYYPFEKGYGIKLFKIEDLPQETRDYAESILYPEQPKRRAKRVTLDSLLFDKTGKLNSQIYQGLQQITMGEDAMHRNKQLSELRSKVAIQAQRRMHDCGQRIEQV